MTNLKESPIISYRFYQYIQKQIMENCFNSKKYLEVVVQNIKDKAEKTKGKLYVEVNWKLLEDDFAQRILPGYDTDNKKKMIIELKRELDILMCVNASAIIDNLPMTKKAIPCVQHLEHTLKRIETVTWIKPHLVITNINPEEMYDIIYNFEIKFQKKWYKVWELYLKKGFPYNKGYLLSENGFWNDDHIPIMKKIALITGIGNGSGKLSTCIGQIYQDHEIGLESSYVMFQTFPIPELPPENPINQAWAKRRDVETLSLDDFGETTEEGAQQSFDIIKDLLGDVVEDDNLIKWYKKVSDMIICPTLECIENIEEVEGLAKKEIEE